MQGVLPQRLGFDELWIRLVKLVVLFKLVVLVKLVKLIELVELVETKLVMGIVYEDFEGKELS
ncbi:hypothetical protein POX_g09023 [Penicillium oxalicum]|uniref:hypothetical protein n=1 Tax=Penicillium oxalicum TaxID=69781 RepID=UPI0020B7C022|nr:hypothetical protein POX_g09023 [Penicillium oxalicum]KAI2786635.1 hypothetical protein POX_g09023 [Penicillium oxalicum]